jgi:hypothetical protein
MTDGNDRLINNMSIPAELRLGPPRSIRFTLTGRAIYYLLGSVIVSAAIGALLMIAGSLTPRELIQRAELKREGKVVYAKDVHVGGMRSATVFYTFTYNGVSYTGESFLPHEYLEKVLTYSRVGGFPLMVLQSNPTISHPSDWSGSGSIPTIVYIFVLILAFQWAVLARSIHYDARLVRDGIAAAAVVTGWAYGRNGATNLEYRFQDSDGFVTKGRGEYPVKQAEGSEICIVYLPDNPERSRPYPPVFFRAVLR